MRQTKEGRSLENNSESKLPCHVYVTAYVAARKVRYYTSTSTVFTGMYIEIIV